MKIVKLPHDVYNCDIWFVRGTRAECQRFVDKRCPDDLSPEARAFRHNTGGRFLQFDRSGYTEYYIFYMPAPQFTRAYTTSQLVHECAHLASSVLADHGVRWDVENDEAFTYYLQWIVSNCLWALWGRAK